jgi:hypothetical protein
MTLLLWRILRLSQKTVTQFNLQTLFAGLINKKGQAKLALFWSKGKVTTLPDGFCVGSTRFEARLCLVSNPRQTGKK